MAQGEIANAQLYVTEVLHHLETNSLQSIDNPFFVYLVCVRVLRASHDPRADVILDTAYHQLQAQAAKLNDESLRQSFLNNVVAHREIIKEFNDAKNIGHEAVRREKSAL